MRFWRWLITWLTGKWAYTPPKVSDVAARTEVSVKLAKAYLDRVLARPTRDNRDLLTGMVVALTAGGWPHKEPDFRGALDRCRRRASRVRGGRLIGRPQVLKYPNGVKVGTTSWAVDYVPRSEVLAAKRRRGM